MEYVTWNSIKHRCHNPNYGGFRKYGARGITMCDEWRYSFENFFADMGERPSKKHSIDRIDPSGPYAPWNCRWATQEVQHINRRCTIFVEHGGQRQTLAYWAGVTGIDVGTLQRRYYDGRSADEILSPNSLRHPKRTVVSRTAPPASASNEMSGR